MIESRTVLKGKSTLGVIIKKTKQNTRAKFEAEKKKTPNHSVDSCETFTSDKVQMELAKL